MGKATRPPRPAPAAAPPKRLGEILTAEGLLSASAARRAARFARRHGQPIGSTLIASGAVAPAAVARALARQKQLPFADLERDPADPALTRPGDFARLASLRAVPWRRDGDGRIVYACAEPDAATVRGLAALHGDEGPGVRVVAADAAAVVAALESGHGQRLASDAAYALGAAKPATSAHRPLWGRRPGIAVAAMLCCAAAILVALARVPGAAALAGLALGTVYAALTLFRLTLLACTARPLPACPPDPDATVPHYTVIVALHDEAGVIPHLAASLTALDYPPGRLEILLVTETADTATRAAIRAAGLDRIATVLAVPDGRPRTKPRALNYALAFARGEIVAVFDAEDRPEPCQLRKAAAAFAEGGPRLACVQARLAFYNARETWLTRLFALDYALWFGHLLPPFARFGWPVPLGGTSNHLRREALLALGGWDAHNVTEDADLGLRLARGGWRVAMLDSTTWEEAPPTAGPWIRQRSRWLKGHAATVVAHARHLRPLVAAAGWRAALATGAFLAGGVITGVVNPLLWGATLAVLAAPVAAEAILPAPVAVAALAAAIATNLALVGAMALGARSGAGAAGLGPWALLTPAYWLLMGIAAWKGLGGLLIAPAFWEKTAHRAAPPAPPSAAMTRRLRPAGPSGINPASLTGRMARRHGARA